jgi:HK97 family phage prohead protease
VKQIFLYKTGSINASIKDVDGKKGIVTGYFSAFNNVDSDGDIIRKGAFSKSILEWGPASAQPRIKHLMNHNSSQPLGKITMLCEDAKGLCYESQIGTHTLGMDFVKMVESNLITEHSIGYQTMKRNQLQDYDEYKKNPNGGWYELTDLKLYEGSSLTAWGANPNTPLTGMKDVSPEDLVQGYINRQKNIEKFCSNSTASDETIQLLLIENKQLTQIIIELTEQVKDTTPQGEDNLQSFAEVLTKFNNSLTTK